MAPVQLRSSFIGFVPSPLWTRQRSQKLIFENIPGCERLDVRASSVDTMHADRTTLSSNALIALFYD
ncbi:hypothetical protein AFLA_000966 [Aspergillus flavus NRRL3357]|nr:hypothetical protein AFLA_000966 [Aspergillus flavus NRRL3357]